MRIVFAVNSLAVGGAERVAVALAQRMASRGHTVALLVLQGKTGHECAATVEAIYLNLRKAPISSVKGMLRGRRFLLDFRPDLIHSHGFHANMFARLLHLLVPGPALLSNIHNVYEGGSLRMLAYRVTDRLSTTTTAVSAAAQERFIRLKAVPAGRCVVMPNAIDTAEFVPSAGRRAEARAAMSVKDAFVWLAVGRIAPAKDYPNLLRAFALVRDVYPQAQLWIAGAGDPGVIELGGAAIEMERRLMEQARWLGFRRDIQALLDAADGFVLASAWEGMPLAVGEAMAMEKPVVATDVGGVRELVGEAGAVVAAGNSDALAQAMLDCMGSTSGDRLRLGAQARARIETSFSMERRADEWERLYRRLLQRP